MVLILAGAFGAWKFGKALFTSSEGYWIIYYFGAFFASLALLAADAASAIGKAERLLSEAKPQAKQTLPKPQIEEDGKKAAGQPKGK